MAALESWGISLILAFQQLSPTLDGLMHLLSLLGQEEFFLVFIAWLYWCVDAGLGLRALSLLLLAAYANNLVKWIFHAPRPFWIDARVKALSVETSYGIPSGHAQIGLAFWGYLAASRARAWVWTAAAALVAAISVSRVYLGMHFPHDVVGGWMLGALLLGGFVWLQPHVSRRLAGMSPLARAGLALLTSLAMVALTVAARAALAGVVDPPEWTANALASAAGAISPRSLHSGIGLAGLVFGIGAGLALGRRRAGTGGPLTQRLLRLALGLVGLFAVRVGLAVLFPAEPEATAMIFRYIRYAMMGVWAVWLAPLAFIRIGLAKEQAP